MASSANSSEQVSSQQTPSGPTHAPVARIGIAKLTLIEERWRDRQQFLASRGYMLRPRLRPNWIPSWEASGKNPTLFEDCIALPPRPNLVDATRVSDGKLMYIKRVVAGDVESKIALMLSEDHLRSDPRNHSVPIIDHFQDADDESISYLVMPFLRLFDSPPMLLVEDLVEFCGQILEGLVFLHEQGVAHRDCTYKNIMMDASALYPRGHHPIFEGLSPDTSRRATVLGRSGRHVQYYYVDYGLSVFIPPDVHPKDVVGTAGRDQEVPELSDTIPYDPFMVDIFIIGNLFRRSFHDKLSNVGFLRPLISSMTQEDPSKRPNAVEALRQWHHIRNSLWMPHLKWGLRSRKLSRWAQNFGRDVASVCRVTFYMPVTAYSAVTSGRASSQLLSQ